MSNQIDEVTTTTTTAHQEHPGPIDRAEYPGGGTPNNPTPDPGVEISTAAVVSKPNELPFTGGDVLGLAGIGLFFAVVGVALQRRAKSKAAA